MILAIVRGAAACGGNSGGCVYLLRRDANDKYELEAANERDVQNVRVVPPVLRRVSLRVLRGHPGVVISLI